MPRVIVDVMPKPEILDPQGKAVARALSRLGYDSVTAVRQGKRFEIEVEGEINEQVLEKIRKAAQEVLSNPVIEDVVSTRAADSSEQNDSTALSHTQSNFEAANRGDL